MVPVGYNPTQSAALPGPFATVAITAWPGAAVPRFRATLGDAIVTAPLVASITGSTTTGARNYGRSGQELIKFDGVVWDQFFGDYNTYEQVQISSAAKGAEAQSPSRRLKRLFMKGIG